MAKLLDEFGIRNLLRAIKSNGGVVNSFKRLIWSDDLRAGTLVGVDRNGNRYFEENRYFFGRNRYVLYNDKQPYDYDASQIDPQWYGWLHYKTDFLPHQDPGRPKYDWMAPPAQNFTGTNQKYVPYSTTRPKIEIWHPPNK